MYIRYCDKCKYERNDFNCVNETRNGPQDLVLKFGNVYSKVIKSFNLGGTIKHRQCAMYILSIALFTKVLSPYERAQFANFIFVQVVAALSCCCIEFW